MIFIGLGKLGWNVGVFFLRFYFRVFGCGVPQANPLEIFLFMSLMPPGPSEVAEEAARHPTASSRNPKSELEHMNLYMASGKSL